MRPEALRVDYATDPLGVDAPVPGFGWVVHSDRRVAKQAAYRIVVGDAAQAVAHGDGAVWDSGDVRSDETVAVPYGGPRLESRRRYWWSVRVTDDLGAHSPWAAPAWFETGLLVAEDWSARWISAPDSVRTPGEPPDGVDLGEWRGERPVLLRASVQLPGAVRARAYVTARGLYELYINGRRVGDEVLAPGWTDYRVRQEYRTFDVAPLLRPGDNVVAAVLASGWYCGRVAWQERIYGDVPQLLVQLEVQGEDGRQTVLTSDESWVAAPAPLLWADLLTGEAFDARLVRPGWNDTGLDDSDWQPVETAERDEVALVAAVGPPVRRLAERPAVGVTEPTPGTYVFDLGQNITGWARLRCQAEPGTVLRLRHVEMLDAEGGAYTENLRGAQALDVVVVGAAGEQTYEPSFTFHGFRYVEVTGLAQRPPAAAVTGIVVGSDVPAAGTFECDDEMVNQLHRNIVWGQRGNFLSVPTDCPQRDERLGWMGDAQIFIGTAAWNADVATFFRKWLIDVRDARTDDGAFPDVAPVVRHELFAQGSPGWGDAGVIVPWVLYERYGDIRFLEDSFDAMKGWVDFLAEHNPGGLWTDRRGMDYGDWLAIGADTPKDVLATAYYACSAALTARVAGILGEGAAQRRYGMLADTVRAAFNEAYVTPSGRIVGHTQTAYVLALAFDLLPVQLRSAAAQFLVEDIRRHDGHLSTGFLGVGHLLPVLTRTGHLDVAYQLLHNDTFPSWGYSIRHGATTIWERWDGWTAENGFQSPGMNSFNHYALGSVGDWLFTTLGGIEPDSDAPGFSRFAVRPRPGGAIRRTAVEYRSVHGTIRSAWERDDHQFRIDVTVPANTSALVHLPGVSAESVTEGDVAVDEADGVEFAGELDGAAVYAVGSGDYRFAGALRRSGMPAVSTSSGGV